VHTGVKIVDPTVCLCFERPFKSVALFAYSESVREVRLVGKDNPVEKRIVVERENFFEGGRNATQLGMTSSISSG
jgi:hypothetical protein